MKRSAMIPGLVAMLSLCLFDAAAAQEAEPAPAADAPDKLVIEVGADVTVFAGPKRADGTIDYISALNEKYRAGVTQDNNAFRDVFLLFDHTFNGGWVGDEAYIPGMMDALQLDAEALRRGPHLADLHDFLEERGYNDEQMEAFYDLQEQDPVGAVSNEDVQACLDRNRPVLEKAMAALDKPRWWAPMIQGDEAGTVIAVILPSLGNHRELARALQNEAYHQALRGEDERAARAIHAMRQLAWHQSQDPTLIGGLVALSIDRIAAETVRRLVSARLLDGGSLTRIDALWRDRPARVSLADTIAVGEKSMVMDAFMQIVSGRLGAEGLIDGEAALVRGATSGAIDVNRGLKALHREYAQVIRIARIQDYRARQRLQAMHDRHLEDLTTQTQSKLLLRLGDASVPNPLALVSKKQRTDLVTTLFITIMMPALGAATNAETRGTATDRCSVIAIACERYRLDEGRLPASLQDLVPAYLNAVPNDPFDGEPIRYQQTADGFKLYAVGGNLEDNGGQDLRARDEGDQVYEIKWRDVD